MAEIVDVKKQALDAAVAEGGAYEILRRRLSEIGQDLRTSAEALNSRRLDEFGKSDLKIAGRLRIRTENNCVARDIVRVGEMLLFGYNVFMGLKKETKVQDVFSLYRLVNEGGEYDAVPLPLQGTFLDDPDFVRDFTELYAYYKNTRLIQLSEWNGRLLASFQIGEKITDVRVFRWSVSPDGSQIKYIDNRGEREITLPPAHDFEWIRTDRSNAVFGRHSHMNILDTIFVETIGGDLTIKRENNTEDGLGIYREDVLDANQSLDDAHILYSKVGDLILLKILPYREESWRYFIYNTLTYEVKRLDILGQASIQLPEDHGLIFPGGYYLQSGECKTFDNAMDGMLFRRMRRSPNGEDALYVFYEPQAGKLALFNYNLIDRKLQNPLLGYGYTLMEDGRLVLFEDQKGEAVRIHPMQIWQTPYYTDEYAARTKTSTTVLSRIGNADLVRGISDILNVARAIETQKISSAIYEKLIGDTRRLFDAYFWLADEENFNFAPTLKEIIKTGELVLDEYEKVESIREQSAVALKEARARQKELFSTLTPENWTDIQEFSGALSRINLQRGKIISLKSLRYMDMPSVETLENELKDRENNISLATAEFLGGEAALVPFAQAIADIDAKIPQAATAAALAEPKSDLERISGDLDTLSNLIGSLSFDDVTLQTRIIENISEIFAKANQCRTAMESRRQSLGENEHKARFGAQFQLFSQGVTAALSMSTDPERCDENLSRLLLQLEELENQFSEYDIFQNDILAKREELLETFATHRQNLVDERQRRAQSFFQSALRILEAIPRRTARFTLVEEVNAFFVSDPLVRKVGDLAESLRGLKDTVKADDLEARFKAVRDQVLRSMRDKTDLYEDGGAAVKLGRHRFSVNTQDLDLTILPQDDKLFFHLTGTDYQESINCPEIDQMREYWQMFFESETPSVTRAEYLAHEFIMAAQDGRDGLNLETISSLTTTPEQLKKLIADFAAQRYKDGYEKGLHDHDAYLIIQKLLPLTAGAGLLKYGPAARALALMFWYFRRHDPQPSFWPERARNCLAVKECFAYDPGLKRLEKEIGGYLAAFAEEAGFAADEGQTAQAAEYLAATLAKTPTEFSGSKYARDLGRLLEEHLNNRHLWSDFQQARRNLNQHPANLRALALNWLEGLTSQPQWADLAPYAEEAAAILITGDGLDGAGITFSETDLRFTVEELMSTHPRIKERALTIAVDDFYDRLSRHHREVLPLYRRFQTLRRDLIEQERDKMRLEEFKARPLSSFVRNKLIDGVYLPIIGDNLAKQMGALGEAKRADLMGMLLLISPPGYGKTTLMEYIAHCLGLTFMKINGPALGREVVSLDPQLTPDLTARQELEKLNLALQMGNNVMLYLDDIQHVSPEFLQKFISLCDGTRRIEGVWKGRTKTYDLRGKKFCVVMAGNPYTESGEVFKIPDMLANRADVYNLGEVLGGMKEAFALSYLENCLTSNPVLAPLAQRDMKDFYLFVDKAEGKNVSANDFSYQYSQAESGEIVEVLSDLIKLRQVVMNVNQQYIASAAQSDKYRTEPPFKLQGSYRNMNKLAQRVSAVMNNKELSQLLDDLYQGEAQLLTGHAEENLLKLTEIRGKLTAPQAARWEEIKRQYVRNKAFGGDDSQVGDRVVSQLYDLVQSIQSADTGKNVMWKEMAGQMADMVQCLKHMAKTRAVLKVSDLLQNAQAVGQNNAAGMPQQQQPQQQRPAASLTNNVRKNSGEPRKKN